MNGKKYTDGYKNQITKYLSESLDLKPIENKKELSEKILSGRTQYIRTVAKVYINILEDNETLLSEDADYFRRAIPSRKT